MSGPLEENKSNLFRDTIGKRITSIVIWGTVVIGIIGIVFAFFALFIDDKEDKKIKAALSVIQYVFGALLPLWGTWIGTVLAFYFSKQSIDSANENVKNLVNKITSDGKLQMVKAKDVMIPKDKLIAQVIKSNEDLSKFKLKDCIQFTKDKNVKRIIILGENENALFAVHRDLISYFISNETLANKPIDNCTLKDMHETHSYPEIKTIMDNSVKFISESANLLDAKNIMIQNKNCQDVFITKNGKADEPILGWITNVTISENSVI